MLNGNGITKLQQGRYRLIGSEELSEGEHDELLQRCRHRLDAFRVEDGNPQRLEVAKERTAIRS